MRPLVLGILLLLLSPIAAEAGPTLDHARAQGVLTCGVTPDIAGFSRQGADGIWRGFDVDICRAVATVLFGRPDKVRFVAADHIDGFLAAEEVDMVLRGLTWNFSREIGRSLRFGPTVFHDGQGFLVPKRLGATRAAQLAGQRICVARGAPESALTRYFRTRKLALQAVLFDSWQAAADGFFAGRCAALSADGFELVATQLGGRGEAAAYRILPERLSKEPLAPLMRRGDEEFFDIVRWTLFALIDAEELGISSLNADALQNSPDPEIRAFLRPAEAPAFAWGWSGALIKAVGHYGEIFERNLGRPAGLARGANAPAAKGGWLTAPPLK